MNRTFATGISLILTAVMFSVTAAADTTEEFQKTVQLSPGAKVTVENVNGAITITAWDNNYADIMAVKRSKHGTKELDKVSIEISTSSGLDIRTRFDKRGILGSSPRVTVDYTIKLPKTADLRSAGTVNGSVALRGTGGDTSAHTTNGSVRAEGVAFIRSAETTNGNIEIENAGLVDHASTTNGSIEASFTSQPRESEFETVNGSISLTFPSGTNANLEFRTVNGSIKIPDGIRLGKGEISRKKLSGQIGAGGPEISAHTVNGGITLRSR